ncbi:hypothetical protein G9P44_000060 [Scheffersomyces stipitis]|nr:hypothetical protein G9P44_000060 [Scheffersomyces stipitis]
MNESFNRSHELPIIEDVENQPLLNNTREIENTNSIENQLKSAKSDLQPRKRGPTTPLAASMNDHVVLRRKLDRPASQIRYLEFGSNELLEAKYQSWALAEQLKRNEELVRFLELEMKFAEEQPPL